MTTGDIREGTVDWKIVCECMASLNEYADLFAEDSALSRNPYTACSP